MREYLAALGFRTLAEAIGHAEVLDTRRAVDHWKASGLDLSPILHVPEHPFGDDLYCTTTQDHGLERALDQQLISAARTAIDTGTPIKLDFPIRNVNRTVGTMLGHELTKKHGGLGLPDDTIDITFTGSAGQSFGAFVPKGITLRLSGDANDYVGKGLSGGRLVLRPPLVGPCRLRAPRTTSSPATSRSTAPPPARRSSGASSGSGSAVRNSGATAVVEGIGDHGCEYMTGGRVVVLGPTGRNFGAGMSGGIAYVFDPQRTFAADVNPEMVELEALDDLDTTWLVGTIFRHRDEHRFRCRGPDPHRLALQRPPVRQGHATRLQAGARGHPARRGVRRRHRRRHHGCVARMTNHMGDVRGF